MDSTQLNPEQVVRLKRTLARQLRYLNQLCQRMQMLRFPPDDPLCRHAQRARDVMQDLYTSAHYSGCETGVGRPPRDAARRIH